MAFVASDVYTILTSAVFSLCLQVVYVTAPLPYVFLTIIMIRGVTLPGSWVGLQFYLKPDWSRLLDVNVSLIFHQTSLILSEAVTFFSNVSFL